MSINHDALQRMEEKLDAICQKLGLHPIAWRVVIVGWTAKDEVVTEVSSLHQAQERLRECYESEVSFLEQANTPAWTQKVKWSKQDLTFMVIGFSKLPGVTNSHCYTIREVWAKED